MFLPHREKWLLITLIQPFHDICLCQNMTIHSQIHRSFKLNTLQSKINKIIFSATETASEFCLYSSQITSLTLMNASFLITRMQSIRQTNLNKSSYENEYWKWPGSGPLPLSLLLTFIPFSLPESLLSYTCLRQNSVNGYWLTGMTMLMNRTCL